MILSELTDKQIEDYRWMRWKARTDLIWLCNNLLDMPDVSRELNGILVDRLQQFPKPKDIAQSIAHDRFDRKAGTWIYRPLVRNAKRKREHLPDPNSKEFGRFRRRLIIDSRGTLKTNIDIFGHTIQWILNYPDIAIGIFQSSKPKAIDLVKTIKGMFQHKPDLRALFPELCPQDDIEKWGTTEYFVCPNRTPGFVRLEPTVKALSLETKMAGMHFDLLKFTDVIERENSQNEDVRNAVIDAFDNAERILVGSNYWIDVEGTMWHFGDLYNEIIRRERMRQSIKKVYMVGDVPMLDRKEAEDAARVLNKKVIEYHNFYVPQPDKRQWQVYINCVFKRDDPKATYDYDDMIRVEKAGIDAPITFKYANGSAAPIVYGSNGIPATRWEERHPGWRMVEEINSKIVEFNFQMMNFPTGGGIDGAPEFKVNEKEGFPCVIPRAVFRDRIRVMYFDAAVDIADTSGRRSDYSCITVGAFDAYGRCYIVDIRHGKWPHDHLINQLFEVQRKYLPQRVMLERGPGANSFMQYLNRMMELERTWLNVVRVPRGSNISKQKRISQALQPYYQNKELIFLDDLGQPYEFLKAELQQWPAPQHDDILDTISDLFFEKSRYGRQAPRVGATPQELLATNEDEMNRRLTYALQSAKEKALERMMSGTSQADDVHHYYRITGGF